MDSDLTITIRSAGAVRQAKAVNRELDRMDVAGEQASRRADIVSRSLRGLGTAAAGYVSIAGLSTITRDLGEIQGINSRLSALTGDLAGQQEFLRRTTDETSASYVVLANSYSRILPLFKAGLITLDQSRTITRGLANVQAETGASAADLGRSMFGLSQALASPIVRAEELNQVVEALPGLLQGLDRAAGLAGGGFRQMVVDGEVTSAFFRDTLITALAEYDGAAAALAGNITQVFNRTRNEYTRAVEAFNEPISSAVVPLAESLADAFALVAENAEEITDAAQLAAVAMGALFLGRLGRRAEDTARGIFEASRAILSAAEASTSAAAAESAAGAARSRNNAIDIVRTASTAKLAEASNSLVVSNAALTTSEARLAETLALTNASVGVAALSYDRATTAALGYNSALATLSQSAVATRATLSAPLLTAPITGGSLIDEDTARTFRAIDEAAASAGPRVIGFGQATGAAGRASRETSEAVLALSASTTQASRSTVASALATAGATARHRAYQAGVLASAAATRAFNAALTLIGGPTGLFFVAAGATAYYALQQTDAEKAVKSLQEEIDDLNKVINQNVTALNQAGEATNTFEAQALQNELNTVTAQLDELGTSFESTSLALNEGFTVELDAVGADFARGALERRRVELQRELDLIIDKTKERNDLENQIARSNALVEYSDRVEGALRRASNAVDSSSASIREAIDGLFPTDAKIADLEDLRVGLESIRGELSTEEYLRAALAIDDQIASLKGLSTSAQRAAEESQALNDALNAAFPDRSRAIEYAEQLQVLEAAYEKGGENAGLYADAIEALESSFNAQASQEVADSLREFNEVISRRTETPFDSYRQDLQLLNDALDEMPDKASQINLALANLDLEVQSELTVIESADNLSELQGFYDQQQQALNDWHAIRQSGEDAAQRDLTTLHENYIEERDRLARDSADRIREFIEASNSSSSPADAFRPNTDTSGQALEDARNAAIIRAQAITDEQERADTLLAINRSYQDQLTDVFRNGEFTREQLAQASAGQRLSGVINRYQAEIDLVAGFADAILGLETQRRQQEAAESLASAKNLAEQSAEAQRAFENNGTEQNRVAAEQARARADIAEAAARRDFEQQKKAQLVQARLSQGLAIVNAYASGGNFLTGIALAATALAVTERQIQSIKAQQFNGGQSLSSGTSASGVSGRSGGGGAVQQNQQQLAQPAQSTSIIIVNGALPNPNIDDLVGGAVKRLSENDLLADADGRALDTRNIREVTIQ